MAKYYEEAPMREIREAFEREVLDWPGVKPNKRFGCPCYEAKGKLFAFIVTGGVVLTALGAEEKKALAKRFFGTARVAFRLPPKWSTVGVRTPMDLGRVYDFARMSYQNALASPKKK